jgi:nucleotide-binding universal stress UspA family protein
MYQRILMPIKENFCRAGALQQCLSLATTGRGHITFLYIVEEDLISGITLEEDVPYDDLTATGRQTVDRALVLAQAAQVAADGKLVEGKGETARTIVDEAKGYDLIVLENHRKTKQNWLIGDSVITGVLHHAEQPVLVVRCSPGS